MFGIQRGSILEFDPHVGVGKVKTSQDKVLFFHVRAVKDKEENIQPGTKAIFEVIPGRQGKLEAWSIHLV